MDSELIQFAGFIIGIVGFVYAVYVDRTRANMTKYLRAQSWHSFAKAINAHGLAGQALDKYKEQSNTKIIDPQLLQDLSQAVAVNNDIFMDSIRQIQYLEPSFTREDINRWFDEGKISENNKKFFSLLCTAANKTNPVDTKNQRS